MITEVHSSPKFKQQFKKYQKNPQILEKLVQCTDELIAWPLDSKRKNHKLQGQYQGKQDLHLFPDIVIIYEVREEHCLLLQIGSHSDLFG